MRLPVCFLAMIMTITCLYLPVSASESVTDSAIREYNAENYEEALDLLQKQKAEGPSSAGSFYIGLSYKQTGRYRDAIDAFLDSISRSPAFEESAYELADIYYRLDEFSEASAWISKAETMGVKPAATAYLKGLILVKQGKDIEALNAFNQAKKADVLFMQQADLQIALIHLRNKKTADAREMLRAVIAADATTETASFAREYERMLVQGAEAPRAWRFVAGLAYQYDDNVVLKPSDLVPGVEITGARDSSIVATFRADYQSPVRESWFMNGQFSLYTNTYFHTTSHSVIAPTLTLMPGYNFNKTLAVTAPLSYSYVWLKDQGYMSIVSARPMVSTVLPSGCILQLGSGYARRDLIQPPSDSAENRDGNIYILTAGVLRNLPGNRGVFSLRYEFSYDDAKGSNWVNNGNKVDIGLIFPVKQKVDLIINTGAFIQDYRNEHTAFLLKRKDQTYTASANMLMNLAKDLNLNIQYSYTRANSNIAIYDYSRNVYTLGLEYSF